MENTTGKDIEQMLIDELGTTDDPELAVWLTRDGRLINGSREGRQRDLDHRHIQDCYPGLDANAAIERFMRRGNVRMGCGAGSFAFEFVVPLSESQMWYLVPWARHYAHSGRKSDFCAIRHSRKARRCEDPWKFLFYIAKHMRQNVFNYPEALF